MLRFFDFDRTLCVHDYPAAFQGNEDYYADCLYELEHQAELHANDKPLPCMRWYARACYDNGDVLYCISHETSSLRNDYKQNFLDRYYGDFGIKFITVDSAVHKIDMIRAIAAHHGCSLEECELVDDLMSTVRAADRAGIIGTHLSNIAEKYETFLLSMFPDADGSLMY